jgi:hypothetical protein
MGGTVRSLAPELPIIEIVSYGTVQRADAERMVEMLAEQCVREGIWCVLDDSTDMVHTLSPADIVQITDHIVSLGVADELRVAFVRPTDVGAAAWVDLWGTAAANRGLRMQVFRERKDAVSWLLSSSDQTTSLGH